MQGLSEKKRLRALLVISRAHSPLWVACAADHMVDHYRNSWVAVTAGPTRERDFDVETEKLTKYDRRILKALGFRIYSGNDCWEIPS